MFVVSTFYVKTYEKIKKSVITENCITLRMFKIISWEFETAILESVSTLC